jgi:hypothetical protein
MLLFLVAVVQCIGGKGSAWPLSEAETVVNAENVGVGQGVDIAGGRLVGDEKSSEFDKNTRKSSDLTTWLGNTFYVSEVWATKWGGRQKPTIADT